jgi:F-type H+-transporting ATPase subunit a
MTMLGLLTGIVQAYIFFILATVYIAAATRSQKPEVETVDKNKQDNPHTFSKPETKPVTPTKINTKD